MKKKFNTTIVYYASSINNRGGGASRSPRNFIKSLIHLGYNVTIISNSIKTDIVNRNTILYNLQKNIEYYRAKYSIRGKAIDNRNDNIFIFILKLIKYITINSSIKSFKINTTNTKLLIIDSLSSHYLYLANKIDHPNKFLIWRMDAKSYFELDKVKSTVDINLIFAQYKKIIFVSKNTLNEWIKIFPQYKIKSTVIYNCIDEIEATPISTNYNLKNILCIGNLHYRKGQDIAYNAIKKIISIKSNITLTFYGKPLDDIGVRLIKSINNNKQKNINYYPYTNNVLELINKYDILIVPSRGEAFPRIVLEGLFCGALVIASNVGGVNEMIDDGYNGFIFDPTKPMQLIEKINYILNLDSNKIKNIKVNARNTYLDKFSQNKQIELFRNLLL